MKKILKLGINLRNHQGIQDKMPLDRTPISQDQMATWNDKSGSWIPPKTAAAAPPSMNTNSAGSNLPPNAQQLEEEQIKKDIAAKAATEEKTGEEDYQSFVETNTKQKQDPRKGDKCIVPFCGKILSTGPKADGEHLYISKCPQLRRLPFETVNMWFKFEELSCDHCFSSLHSSQDCQFTNIKCKKVVKDGENTRRCGGSHHMALHNPRKHGIVIQVSKAENQSKDEAKED